MLVFLLLKMALKCSVEVLASVPKHKKTVMCFSRENVLAGLIHVWVIVLLIMSSMLMNQKCYM